MYSVAYTLSHLNHPPLHPLERPEPEHRPTQYYPRSHPTDSHSPTVSGTSYLHYAAREHSSSSNLVLEKTLAPLPGCSETGRENRATLEASDAARLFAFLCPEQHPP